MANSVDPDQMPHSVASDLGLHCLGLSVPIFRVITVGTDMYIWESTFRPYVLFSFTYAFMFLLL